MKRFPLLFILASLVFVPACQTRESPSLAPIEVHFSPKGGCTEAVVQEINAAQTSILVQAYSFTSAPIANALVDAHKRGVHIDAEHAIAHNKVMVIDGQTVITG
jgi:phosphatidylserine/phosphatidylglycerophosphate/cardiolipin synthase-like enzyme